MILPTGKSGHHLRVGLCQRKQRALRGSLQRSTIRKSKQKKIDIAFGNSSEKRDETADSKYTDGATVKYEKHAPTKQNFQTGSLQRKAIRRSINKNKDISELMKTSNDEGVEKHIKLKSFPVPKIPTPAPRKSLNTSRDKCSDMNPKDQSYLPNIDGKYKSRENCQIIFSIKPWDERSKETSRKVPEKLLLEWF